MNIRQESPADFYAVHELICKAFEREDEGNLVDVLRNTVEGYISLVADIDGLVVGHILFTPVTLSGNNMDLNLIGLAPLAVLPEFQSRGVGSKLVQAGLQRCQSIACDALVVLGHPQYYPKFGFVPSVKYGIKSEYNVSDDTFMILELVEGALQGETGTIQYHQAFASF